MRAEKEGDRPSVVGCYHAHPARVQTLKKELQPALTMKVKSHNNKCPRLAGGGWSVIIILDAQNTSHDSGYQHIARAFPSSAEPSARRHHRNNKVGDDGEVRCFSPQKNAMERCVKS